LGALGLEEEARRLVEAAPQALQQSLGAAERIGDPEGGLNPLPDLPRTAESPGLDLSPELLGLGGCEFAGIALIVEGTEGVQPLLAIEAEPVADGARAHAEQVGDVARGLAFVVPQQGGQPHGQTVVPGLLATTFDLLALR